MGYKGRKFSGAALKTNHLLLAEVRSVTWELHCCCERHNITDRRKREDGLWMYIAYIALLGWFCYSTAQRNCYMYKVTVGLSDLGFRMS